jgi:hypothetical protein
MLMPLPAWFSCSVFLVSIQSQVNFEGYSRIRIGMSMAETEAILDKPHLQSNEARMKLLIHRTRSFNCPISSNDIVHGDYDYMRLR